MGGIAISTAGVSLKYAVEKQKGTRPNSEADYTTLSGIKEVPEMNPEPETLESTDLSETEYKTYIEGLKDLGGALAFLANHTNALMEEWNELLSKYREAKKKELNIWFYIDHPDLKKGVFFTGQPSPMGLPAMSVSSILEVSLYITPTNAPEWLDKPQALGAIDDKAKIADKISKVESSTPCYGKNASELGTVEFANGKLTGTLKMVTGYDGFSGDTSQQSGYFLPFLIDEENVKMWVRSSTKVTADKSPTVNVVFLGKTSELAKEAILHLEKDEQITEIPMTGIKFS